MPFHWGVHRSASKVLDCNLAQRRVAPDEDEPRAHARERKRRLKPQPAGSSGDDDSLAGKACHPGFPRSLQSGNSRALISDLFRHVIAEDVAEPPSAGKSRRKTPICANLLLRIERICGRYDSGGPFPPPCVLFMSRGVPAG